MIMKIDYIWLLLWFILWFEFWFDVNVRGLYLANLLVVPGVRCGVLDLPTCYVPMWLCACVHFCWHTKQYNNDCFVLFFSLAQSSTIFESLYRLQMCSYKEFVVVMSQEFWALNGSSYHIRHVSCEGLPT